MNLQLKRWKFRPGYTVGQLYINNVKFCDTLEFEGGLPEGTYDINLSTIKYKEKGWAHNGKVPAVVIDGKRDNLIFIGTSPKAGRIIVGKHERGSFFSSSKDVFHKLLGRLTSVFEKITLTIE